ncbi:MAG TPA: hypothetical protein P5121_16275 [Caldilineaceae bacterium]|nr:hypothetical protein [Caldilineaceae bacterium]
MSNAGDQFQFFRELATKIISVTEASELEVQGESLSTRQIQRLIKEGKMAGIRLGHNYYTSREAVRDYLRSDRRTGPKPSTTS